jgi:hypothetical protein
MGLVLQQQRQVIIAACTRVVRGVQASLLLGGDQAIMRLQEVAVFIGFWDVTMT